MINKEVNQIIGASLKFSLKTFLLYIQKRDNILLGNLLIAAKLLLAKELKYKTKTERLLKCNNVMLMSKLSAISKIKEGQVKATSLLSKVWRKFLSYWNISRLQGSVSEQVIAML